MILAHVVLAPALLLGNACTVESAGREKPGCCFNNPAYAGVCRVEPSEGETCASILSYLNDPQSTGKTYCESTRIRGGWKEVDCEKSSTMGGAEKIPR